MFNKLRERGYQIKNGKHIAVKLIFAERYVRLKTLDEAYLPKNLEQRIADRDKFPNAVREKFQTANAVEKKIQIVIMDMVVEVKQFRLAPKKLELGIIYVFQNDANINYLSEQLVTIGKFNISSREQMYAKAEKLKNGIDGKTAKLKELSDELPPLKSDIAQLRHLFSADGNSRRHDVMERTKLAVAREIADKYGVKSEGQIAELEKRLEQLLTAVSLVKSEIADEQIKLKRITDLINVYEKIVDGNYVDNLISSQVETEKNKVVRKHL